MTCLLMFAFWLVLDEASGEKGIATLLDDSKGISFVFVRVKLKFSRVFLIYMLVDKTLFYFQIKCPLTTAYHYPPSGFIPNLLM